MKKAAIIFLVIICFFIYFSIKTKKINDIIQYEEKLAEDLPIDSLNQKIELSEKYFNESIEILKKHRYSESRSLMLKAFADFDSFSYKNAYSSHMVSQNQNVHEWFKEKKENLEANLLSELDYVLDLLSKGDYQHKDVDGFIINFRDKFNSLDKVYHNRRAEIETIRAKNANKWFWAHADKSYQLKGIKEILDEVLHKKWPDPFAFKLITGPAFSNLEKRNMWKELQIEIKVVNEQYQEAGKEINRANVMEIPKSVILTFTAKRISEIKTNWDNLEPITVEIDLPKSFTEKKSSNYQESQVKLDFEKKILEKVKEAFDKIPPFKLFPGIDTASLKLVKDLKFDIESAYAMKILCPLQFEKDAKEILNENSNTNVMASLIRMLVDSESGTFYPSILSKLPSLPSNDQEYILNVLKNKPWLFDYKFAICLIQNAEAQTARQALYLLKGQLDRKKFQQVILEKIDKVKNYEKSEYATFFLNEIPKQELADYAKWVLNQDEKFAGSVYQTIFRRDKDLASQIALSNFTGAPSNLKKIFLGNLEFSYEKYGADKLEILKELASPDSNSPLQMEALMVIKKASDQKEVWEALYEIAQKYDEISHDKNSKSYKYLQQISYDLISKAGRIYPDKRNDILMKMIDSFGPVIRNSATDALLFTDEPKDDIIIYITEKLQVLNNDPDFEKTLYRALSQQLNLRQKWNYEQPELIKLLKNGIRSTDPEIRNYTYNSMETANRKEIVIYKKFLEEGLNIETDPKAFKTIKRILKR